MRSATTSGAIGAPSTVPTVLVVDDILALNAAILRTEGYRVLTTESVVDACVLLARETPDVIVLDYMMPAMDAPMFLRQIRNDPRLRDIGVILLAASSQADHIETAFASGGDDFLIKPVDRGILVARVKAMLDASRARVKASVARSVAKERDDLLREVGEARTLQDSQLPSCPTRWDGWRLEGTLLSCGRVGGDMFDVIAAGDGGRIIALLDVSGHGLAAAMVASSVRSSLRLLARDRPTDDLLAALNLHLCHLDDLHACVAVLQVAPDHVTIVNAGLPPVAVIVDGRLTRLVGPNGTPPGLLPDSTYEAVVVPRRPGMRFVVTSDGLTEPFGASDDTSGAVARLGLLDRAPLPDGDLARRVSALFPAGRGAQPDDATVLVLSDERSPD